MNLSSNLQTMWHGGCCVITSWIRFGKVSKNEYLTVFSWSRLLFWPEFLMKVVCFLDHSEFLKNPVVVYKIRRGLQYLFGIFNFSSWIFKRDLEFFKTVGKVNDFSYFRVSFKGCPSLFFLNFIQITLEYNMDIASLCKNQDISSRFYPYLFFRT